MNTKIKKLIIVISITTALTFTATSIPGFKSEARADHGGAAFLGGMLAGHLVTGAVQRDKEQSAAMNEMAYGHQKAALSTFSSSPQLRKALLLPNPRQNKSSIN